MTKLHECLSNSREALQRNKQAQGNKTDSKKMEKQLADVSKSIVVLKNLLSTSNRAGEKLAPECSATPEQYAEVVNALGLLAQDLQSGALSEQNVLGLSQTEKKVSNDLRSIWRTKSQEKASGVTSLLRALRDFTPSPTETERVITILTEGQKDLPKTLEAIDKFAEYVETGSKIIEETGADYKTQQFIKLVVEKKATLEDLDEDIFKWLKSHYLLGRLTIGISTSNWIH